MRTPDGEEHIRFRESDIAVETVFQCSLNSRNTDKTAFMNKGKDPSLTAWGGPKGMKDVVGSLANKRTVTIETNNES